VIEDGGRGVIGQSLTRWTVRWGECELFLFLLRICSLKIECGLESAEWRALSHALRRLHVCRSVTERAPSMLALC